MKPHFLWLFFAFYVSAVTSAELRTKRDLVLIQNIIKWLLGDVNIIKPIPLTVNEQQRIYAVPAYENLVLSEIPHTEIKEHLTVSAEGLHPRKIVTSVQSTHNSFPIDHNNYSSGTQGYTKNNQYYMHERPMHSYINQAPTYSELAARLCPIGATEITVCGGSGGIIAKTRQTIPQRPLYIQKRMRDVILNPVPPVHLQQNVVATHTSHIINNAEQFLPRVVSKVEAQFKTNPIDNGNNKVSFNPPVQSKYKYKMVYHNQPERNTVIEMDSMHAEASKLSVVETPKPVDVQGVNRVSKPARLTVTKDKDPVNYMYVPPVSAAEHLSGLSRINPPKYDEYRAENRPTVAMDGSLTSDATEVRPTKVIVRRRKINAPQPDISRGDIPELSVQ